MKQYKLIKKLKTMKPLDKNLIRLFIGHSAYSLSGRIDKVVLAC